ncbi:hypothetical protein Cus16_2475 [Curtobacterium sp. ER1/6]|nr:hypothetical protein Cus16_2475 [Curtobacterium sp. ER1/6]
MVTHRRAVASAERTPPVRQEASGSSRQVTSAGDRPSRTCAAKRQAGSVD